MNWLIVAFGGGLGTLGRYLIGQGLVKFLGLIPLGTLIVNLGGSFLAGMLIGIVSRQASGHWKDLVFIGFLGGFTTFSALSLETTALFRGGNAGWAILNLLLHNAGGILMVLGGLWISGIFFGGNK